MAQDFSLFGASPQEAGQQLQQQRMAEAMQIATQAGPQGNPYYIPSVGAGLRAGAGNMAQAAGGMFGMAPPQIQKAYQMEAIMKEVESSGVEFDKDPVGYAKVASSIMLKNGMRDEALKAIQWAQKWQSEQADMEYKGALGNQANAVATEKKETLDEKQALMTAQADLASAKANQAKIVAEIEQLKEARKAAREPTEIALLNARIKHLEDTGKASLVAAAKKVGSLSKESINQLASRLLTEEYDAGRITRDQYIERAQQLLVNPMNVMMAGMLGGQQFEAPVTNPRMPPAKAPTLAPVEKPYPAKPEEGVTYKPQPGYSNEKAAIKAWGKYEPDKYEYRVNPTTGKIQRKAK